MFVNEKINYGEGFKILMEKHDSLNNKQHTAKAMKNAFENSKTVAEEYIEFNIRTEDQISDTGERWIVYPVISNSSVTGLVAGILNKEETTVEFRNLKPGNEYYDQLIPLFREQYQKSLISARQLNKNGKCGHMNQPPCEIDVIIITPPNSGGGGGIGIGIGGGGGEGTPKPCSKYENCIHNDPGGGGGGGDPLPYENPQTPCEKVKTQTTNLDFKNNITILQGKTGESSERGYRMDYQNQTALNPLGTGTKSQFLQNKPGSNVIDYKYFLPSTYAIIHTHYDSLNDPIFSPGDIIQFNDWLVNAKAWNDNPANTIKIDLTRLTYTLVTSQGNYTFTFDGTDVAPFSNYDINKLNNDYINEVIKPNTTVANMSGNVIFNMKNIEEKFLRFAKANLNMSGMKLFKVEDSGNTEIFLKPNNNRDTKPCN